MTQTRKARGDRAPETIRGALDGVQPPLGRVAAATAWRLLAAAAALSLPVGVGMMVQELLSPDRDASSALPWVALLAGALLVFAISEYAANVVAARARFEMLHALRLKWFDRLQRAPFEHVDRGQRQNSVALVVQDAPRLASLIVSLPTQLAYAGVVFVGAMCAMAWISWPLTVALAAAAPFAILSVRAIARGVQRRAKAYWDADVELIAHTDQTFAALAAVKSFAAEDERARRFDAMGERAAAMGVSHQRLVATLGPLTQLISFGAVVFVVFAGAYWVDDLSPDTLAVFVMYGLLSSGTLRTASSAFGTFHEGLASAARFSAGAPVEPERAGGIRLEDVRGEVELDGIVFSYPDRTKVFAGQTSLLIRAGDTVVIRGENGAGKSTLVSLLLRFREPRRGTVRLDGMNARDLDLYWYRRQFAVVHQDPTLFDGTLRDNVTLGLVDATDEQIEAACRAALLDELIDHLPRGLDTRVGDAGTQLSGGQRQRVALARAFLVNAPILVLDEATSMFDPASEERFVRRNRERFAAKTVIWISHGDTALEVADRVLSLRDGEFRAPLRKVEAHG